MRAIVFCGASGVGKTTLIEGVIGQLKQAGQRVSVVKHAHRGFDIDTPGKDSWRHRAAGATEVLLASDHRLALLREYVVPGTPSLHALIAEVAPCDWLLIEGFKHADLPKIEVWRAALGEPVLYPHDPYVMALATDTPTSLPEATLRPVFALADAAAVATWLLDSGERFVYEPAHHG